MVREPLTMGDIAGLGSAVSLVLDLHQADYTRGVTAPPILTGGFLGRFEAMAEEHDRLEAEVQAAKMAERHRVQTARQRPRTRRSGPPYMTVP